MSWILRWLFPKPAEPVENPRLKQLETELAGLRTKWDNCSAQRSLLLAQYDQATRDIQYLEERLSDYSAAVATMAPVPRFKSYTRTAQEYDPWMDFNAPPQLSSIYDRKYLCFTEADWLKQLDVIARIVKNYGGKYVPETWDCENFAWLAWSLYHRGCKEAELKAPGCFGWARSLTHAYNCFRVKDGRWLVWEPQTGKTVGKVGETSAPYDSIKIKI